MSAQPIEKRLMHASWWRDAVVYQVYLRSFADGNGDGVGDFAGLRARLPYLAELGVDAVWVTPHYVSGGADGGYDVVDFTAVDPSYGTAEDVRLLVEDAHALGLRVLLDIVPNHTSDQHEWFRKALADPNSPEADLYHFRPASPLPPNNWQSMFGGSAWSQTPDGRWYLHLFTPQQPDLNWDNPAVAEAFDDVLRFWFDLGVDGFRVDVAYGLFKDPLYRDNPGIYSPTLFGHGPEQAMTTNQPRVHQIWRRWRAVCDSYAGDRMLVGEVSLADLDEVGRYARPDELHHAFQFRLLKSDWDAAAFADTIDEALTAFEAVGAPAPWVLGNHDKARQVTRYGSEARARAAALLMLALPGSAYLYAGEELGLPEAFVPDEARRDPIFFRSGGKRAGRDGCRIPMPWAADEPNTGFSVRTPAAVPAASVTTSVTASATASPATSPTASVTTSPTASPTASPAASATASPAAAPWLPIPADWPGYAVDRQKADPGSTLSLYRQALRLRALHPALGSGHAVVTRDGEVIRVDLVARHGDASPVTCWINMGAAPVVVPAGQPLLSSSAETDTPNGGVLKLNPDTTVWVLTRTPRP